MILLITLFLFISTRATGAISGLFGWEYDGYYADAFTYFDSATQIGNRLNPHSIDMSDTDNHSSYKWWGKFCPTGMGEYAFRTQSDDASHVVINGNIIVDNGGKHGRKSKSASITVTSIECMDIEVYYGNNNGNGEMKLDFRKPSMSTWSTDFSSIFYTNERLKVKYQLEHECTAGNNYGTQYTESETPTIQDCANMCNEDEDCEFFTYGNINGFQSTTGSTSDGVRANDCIFVRNGDFRSGWETSCRWNLYSIQAVGSVQIDTGYRCGSSSGGWLQQYQLGLEGCANLVLSQSSATCSHEYFHYADATSDADRNCGCVTPGSNCEDSLTHYSMNKVSIYKIPTDLAYVGSCQWHPINQWGKEIHSDPFFGFECPPNQIISELRLQRIDDSHLHNDPIMISCCELGGHSVVVTDTCIDKWASETQHEGNERATCEGNSAMVAVFDLVDEQTMDPDHKTDWQYSHTKGVTCCDIKYNTAHGIKNDFGINRNDCEVISADIEEDEFDVECPENMVLVGVWDHHDPLDGVQGMYSIECCGLHDFVAPTQAPSTSEPSTSPTPSPTELPTTSPSKSPTPSPTQAPVTSAPSTSPTTSCDDCLDKVHAKEIADPSCFRREIQACLDLCCVMEY